MPVICCSGHGKSPSPPFRGEREGPVAQRWEGEVGQAANRPGGPPHPALSPRPAGGEGKGTFATKFRRFTKFVLELSADSLAPVGKKAEVRGPGAFRR